MFKAAAPACSPALLLLLLHLVSPICLVQNPPEEVLLYSYFEEGLGPLSWVIEESYTEPCTGTRCATRAVIPHNDIRCSHFSEGLHIYTCVYKFGLHLIQPHKNITWDFAVQEVYQGLNKAGL